MSVTAALLAGVLAGLFLGLALPRLTRRGGGSRLRQATEDLEARVESGAADLSEANARLRSIIDSAVDGIIVIDQEGRIEAFNAAAERLFGYAEQEVCGLNVKVLMPSPYHEEHDHYLERYRDTGVKRIIGIGREVTGRRRDGSSFPLHLSVGEMRVGGERKFTGILHDLSARVAMEEQLREQASLARLGEMAAVIAHEVKNPLAGVRGAIEVIGSRLPRDSRDAVIVREIVARVDALNELMKDLLLFARPPQPRPIAVDVGPLIATTVRLLAQDPQLAGVTIEVAGTAPPIQADADMLQIVFQNLLVNAAHAMEGHGAIRVGVRSANSACIVDVADSGPGIPDDVRAKIFTAFFTTKSRGTGLGLPTARRLVDAHNGTITVECPPSGGTTVSVQIPYGA